jgi:hypothetical protein
MAGQPIDLGGLPIPDDRPLFLVVLGVHVAAGLWCVAAGALAATVGKRPGRHPRAGRLYFGGLIVLVVSLTVLSILRWPQTLHLLVIGLAAMGAAAVGVVARRRAGSGWLAVHAVGMATSYIGLLTGFLVDNGPLLPVWREVPHLLHWTLPTAVGGPLLARALLRRRRRAVVPPASG